MIETIELTNFKCFENQSIRLGALTLLTGLNGMGKSSVLQSLLLLRQSHHQHNLNSSGLALNGELVSIGTAKDALFEGAIEEQIGFSIAWRNGKIGNWLFNYDRQSDVLGIVSIPASEDVFKESLFGDSFNYLQAERVGPRPSFQMSDYSVRQHGQLGTQGEYAGHFLATFDRKDIPIPKLAHPKAESLGLRDQVEAWISEVTPGTRIHLNQYAGMDLVNIEFSFVSERQVATNHYRTTNVGFGLTYVLPILVAILSSEPGTLLLLENPEAHLHPKGQSTIAKLMSIAAQHGVQILIETHSDHILNGVRVSVRSGLLQPDNARIHFFSREENKDQIRHSVISPHIDKNGRIDSWPEGFFDEWDKSLESLLMPPEE